MFIMWLQNHGKWKKGNHLLTTSPCKKLLHWVLGYDNRTSREGYWSNKTEKRIRLGQYRLRLRQDQHKKWENAVNSKSNSPNDWAKTSPNLLNQRCGIEDMLHKVLGCELHSTMWQMWGREWWIGWGMIQRSTTISNGAVATTTAKISNAGVTTTMATVKIGMENRQETRRNHQPTHQKGMERPMKCEGWPNKGWLDDLFELGLNMIPGTVAYMQPLNY